MLCIAQDFPVYDAEFIKFPDGNYIPCRDNIAMDSTEMVWIATPNQLLLYDGSYITNFSSSSPLYQLDIEDIQIFRETSDGNFLLLDSENKVYLFDPYQKTITHTLQPDTVKYQNLLKTQSEESTGSLFTDNNLIANDEGGFYLIIKHRNEDFYYVFQSKAGKEITFVKQIHLKGLMSLCYAKGHVFLTQQDGIYQYDKAFELKKRHKLPWSSEEITPFLTADDEGQIYAYENCNSSDCKLYRYEPSTQSFNALQLPPTLNMNGIHKFRSVGGYYWFFGVQKLIQYGPETGRYKNLFQDIMGSFAHLDPPPLISHFNAINLLKPDMLWLTSGYGLVQLHPQNKVVEIILKSDPEHCKVFCSMRGMASDKRGNIWISSYSGVKRLSPDGSIESITRFDNLLDKGIYSLNIKDDWMMVNDIIYHLPSGTHQLLLPNKQNGHVTNTAGADNDFWLSTCYTNGNEVALYHYDIEYKSLQEIQIPESIKQAGQFTDLSLSRDKESLWITTANNGSYKYSITSDSFESLTPPSYWEKNNARHYCIYEHPNGSLFVGTSESLLHISADSAKISTYVYDDMLTDGTMKPRNYFSILSEGVERLWLGTDKGIVSFDLTAKTFSTLSHLGRVGKEEFNRESFHKDRDGKLYFGSVNGVYILDPVALNKLNDRSHKKIAHITSQYFDGKSQNIIIHMDDKKQQLDLQHNDKVLRFKLGLPEYGKDQKSYYSYLLEGTDTDWSEANTDNEIEFYSLAPGEYNLKVKGGYDPQILNSQMLNIPFTIAPPWYNLWWVRFLLFLAGIGIASLIFLNRYRQIQKYEQLRSDISKDLHDDVGTILTGIAMQSELLEAIVPEDNKAYAQKIADNSRLAMSSMRDTVWAIDARKDTTKDLLERIMDYIDDTLFTKNIVTNIDSNIKRSEKKILPNIRQNVYLIAKESINNIAKHSATNKVDLSLHLLKKELILKIKDYAPDKKVKTSGQGLENMKKRAEVLNGKYSFGYDKNGYLTNLVIPLS